MAQKGLIPCMRGITWVRVQNHQFTLDALVLRSTIVTLASAAGLLRCPLKGEKLHALCSTPAQKFLH